MKIEPNEYNNVLHDAKQTIISAQQHFLQNANRTNIELYWELGKLLAKTAYHYQWGKQVLAKLSQDLTLAFSNARGYSEQNLRHMRQFYYEYISSPELLDIAKNVRWSTNWVELQKRGKCELSTNYI